MYKVTLWRKIENKTIEIICEDWYFNSDSGYLMLKIDDKSEIYENLRELNTFRVDCISGDTE